ncbi:ATP-binding protein [Actinosynnema sp. NPDC053489]|uniref:ATP-binding protein n=1 Tax=Actinosynnema sp. NPDC053489 TaxID=3363916 RepID=UPI0037C706B9
MAVATSFGDFLRFYRLRASLTQDELAERTGVSVRAIRDAERGRATSPRRSTVLLLAEGLGLTEEETGDLLAKAERPAPPGDEQPEVPRELPPALPDLTGRRSELRLLADQAEEAASSPTPHVTVVHGPPGVGKTSLVVSAGHELGGRFADGCLFLDLRGTRADRLDPDQAVRRLLRACGVRPADVPADSGHRLALYRSVLRDRSVLLILDNPLDEAQVRPLLVTGPGSMVLISSRNLLVGLHATSRLELGLLPEPDAVDLLGTIVGRDRVAAEPEETARVVRLCGGVPLALRISGDRLAGRPGWPVARLADQLADERHRLSALSAGDVQVRAAFELSYRVLDDRARAVFRRLSLLPSADVGVGTAAVVAGLPPDDTEAVLEQLTDASLLGVSAKPGRYTVHDLLRLFAAERLERDERPEAVQAARLRARDWPAATATAAARCFTPGHEPPDEVRALFPDLAAATAWLLDEQANWLGALRLLVRDGQHRQVLDLATAMHWYSDHQGDGSLWLEVFTAGADAARALGAADDEAAQLNFLCWTHYILLGRPQDALEAHRRALRVATEAGNLVEQAWALYYRGGIEVVFGSPTAAVDFAEESVRLFEEAGYPLGEHLAWSALGKALHRAGRFEEAVGAQRRAIQRYRRWQGIEGPATDNSLGVMLMRLGESLSPCGRHEEALEAFAEADACFTANAARTGLANVNVMRGELLGRMGEFDAAHAQFTTALGGPLSPNLEMRLLLSAASLCEEHGRSAETNEYRVRAYALCDRFDAPGMVARRRELEEALGIAGR